MRRRYSPRTKSDSDAEARIHYEVSGLQAAVIAGPLFLIFFLVLASAIK